MQPIDTDDAAAAINMIAELLGKQPADITIDRIWQLIVNATTPDFRSDLSLVLEMEAMTEAPFPRT